MLNPKAYTEVFYIINEMSEEMKNKIPEKILKNIENRMDKNYEFLIEDIENIELLDDTEKILSVLYTDYFATNEEKEVIINKENILKQRKNEKILTEIKMNELFPNNIKQEKNKESNLVNNSDIKWYRKIVDFFKNILNKKSN